MISYFLYRFFYLLSKHLPLKFVYGVAVVLSTIKYYCSPRDRKAVINNLKLILPESRHAHLNRYAKEVFVNFGKYLVEFFRFPLLKKEDLGRLVKIRGIEYVDQALKNKKGAIILAAHLGNWELGGVFMALLGYPMIAVALPHRHHKVNSFFNRQRERMGVVVIPSLGIAVRHIYKRLQNNQLVALVGDRDFANAGRRMKFLGATKVIPRGPAVLSLRTGAPIVPGFVIRHEDNTHTIEFLEPLKVRGSEEEIMTAYAKIIEEQILKYPTQWMMFREFWKE